MDDDRLGSSVTTATVSDALIGWMMISSTMGRGGSGLVSLTSFTPEDCRRLLRFCSIRMRHNGLVSLVAGVVVVVLLLVVAVVVDVV